MIKSHRGIDGIPALTSRVVSSRHSPGASTRRRILGMQDAGHRMARLYRSHAAGAVCQYASQPYATDHIVARDVMPFQVASLPVVSAHLLARMLMPLRAIMTNKLDSADSLGHAHLGFFETQYSQFSLQLVNSLGDSNSCPGLYRLAVKASDMDHSLL